jgi:hypothetical protein
MSTVTSAECQPLESWGLDRALQLVAPDRAAGRRGRAVRRVGRGGRIVDAAGRGRRAEGLVPLYRLVPLVADEQPRTELARANVFGLEPLA